MEKSDKYDPILRKTEPNDSKPKKRRAASFVIASMIVIGAVVFVAYASVIGFTLFSG
ncbi:hypothetical protein [Agrobacterium tumefaciens]|uniref:hypothetical protein n=1 Tax=Agrobacterium tumefaciens TaxID=358 RepID=UPI00287E416D|nr:hypothetical protein [Agrobacterium tumefaciens]MDS7594042.1 hypothetical protein [Agrobacterium tumefaciens]